MNDQNNNKGNAPAGGRRSPSRIPPLSLALSALVLIAGCSGGATVPGTAPTPGTTPSIPQVTTLAGSGAAASVDGSGRQASLDAPSDITIDQQTGNLYVLEASTGSIRKVDALSSVTTLTRALVSPAGLTYNPADGALYAAEPTTSAVERIGANGAVTQFAQVATGSGLPPEILGRLSADALGNLSITENRAGKVVALTPAGSVSTTAVAPGVDGISYNPTDRKTYTINQAFGEVDAISNGSSVPVIASTMLQGATGIAYDVSNGAFYIASPAKNQILKVANGVVSVFAGTGTSAEVDGVPLSSQFNAPTAIVYNANLHALFVVDSGGNVVRQISSFE